MTIAACSDARRWGRAAAETRAMPTTFTSRRCAHSASSFSDTSPIAPMPALFTSASRPPSDSAACATLASTAARSVMSHEELEEPAVACDRAIDDRDLRASLGEQPGRRGADAAGASGHEGGQSVEVAHVSSLIRGSTWILGAEVASWGRQPRQCVVSLAQGHDGGDQRTRIDGAGGVRRDGARQPGGAPEDPDRLRVLERDLAGVDQARLGGEADEDHPPPGLDQVHRQCGDRPGVRGVDDRVEGHVGQVVERGGVTEAALARELRPRPRDAGKVDLHPPAPARCATSRPIVPVPTTSSRSPGVRGGRLDGAQRVATGSTIAPAVSSTVSGRGGGPCRDTAASRRGRRGSCRGCRSRTGARTRGDDRWRQRRHVPQPSMVSPVTRRPIHAVLDAGADGPPRCRTTRGRESSGIGGLSVV